MKLETSVELKYESMNYLDEAVYDAIWNLLYQNFTKLPKDTELKITLEFNSLPNAF